MTKRKLTAEERKQLQIQRELKWQSLTLADDFLFGKIMSDPELCKEMIDRIFPSLKIGDIEVIQTQKRIKNALHIRGIQLDLFANTNDRRVFDFEIQTTSRLDQFKRTRAYHIAIGFDGLKLANLKQSGFYDDLPETFVVFICTFDPFGKGRHVYSFENYCTEDREIKLNDGGYTVFLNTDGTMNDISPRLQRFLDYIAGRNASKNDRFIRTLNTKLKEAKENVTWRREYMLLLSREAEKFAEGRIEGRAEGRIEGRAEGRIEGRAEGRIEGIDENRKDVAADMIREGEPLSKILKYSRLAEDTIFAIARSLGVNLA